MKANFYPQLTMRDHGRRVDASGPLNWEQIPPEVARVAIVAVITQNGVRGRGTSREYRRGPAPCAGTLFATAPGGPGPWPWVGDPELVDE